MQNYYTGLTRYGSIARFFLAYDCGINDFNHFGLVYGGVVIAKRLVCVRNLLFGKTFCFRLGYAKVKHPLSKALSFLGSDDSV